MAFLSLVARGPLPGVLFHSLLARYEEESALLVEGCGTTKALTSD